MSTVGRFFASFLSDRWLTWSIIWEHFFLVSLSFSISCGYRKSCGVCWPRWKLTDDERWRLRKQTSDNVHIIGELFHLRPTAHRWHKDSSAIGGSWYILLLSLILEHHLCAWKQWAEFYQRKKKSRILTAHGFDSNTQIIWCSKNITEEYPCPPAVRNIRAGGRLRNYNSHGSRQRLTNYRDRNLLAVDRPWA